MRVKTVLEKGVNALGQQLSGVAGTPPVATLAKQGSEALAGRFHEDMAKRPENWEGLTSTKLSTPALPSVIVPKVILPQSFVSDLNDNASRATGPFAKILLNKNVNMLDGSRKFVVGVGSPPLSEIQKLEKAAAEKKVEKARIEEIMQKKLTKAKQNQKKEDPDSAHLEGSDKISVRERLAMRSAAEYVANGWKKS